MQDVLLDKFFDSNGVSIASHTPAIYPRSKWTQTASNSFQIENNSLQTNRNTNGDLAVIDSGISDFNLTCKTVPIDNAGNIAYSGVVFRYQDSTNYWYAFADSANDYVRIYKVVAGTSTLMLSYTITLVSAVEISIGINCIGANIILFVSGIEIGTVVDTQFQTASFIGVRAGKVGDGSVIPQWNSIEVTPFTGQILNWPLFTEYASNPIVPLGAGGSWEDSDINDPNVIFDPIHNRYVLLYSGYKVGGGNVQALGISYASSILGTWTKESGNPVFSGGGTFGQNGGIVSFNGLYYYYYGSNSASKISCAISKDLITWVDQGVVLGVSAGKWDSSAVFDAFARVRQDGKVIELWYAGSTGISGSNAIGYATSTNGINFTKSSSNPIYANGNLRGEPSVFVPKGKEGMELLLSFDMGGNVGYRMINQILTIDGSQTWHSRMAALTGSGSGWESNQVFDSFIYPNIINNIMYLFHSGGDLSGGALGLDSQIGVASAPWPFISFDGQYNNKNPYATKLDERF